MAGYLFCPSCGHPQPVRTEAEIISGVVNFDCEECGRWHGILAEYAPIAIKHEKREVSTLAAVA